MLSPLLQDEVHFRVAVPELARLASCGS